MIARFLLGLLVGALAVFFLVATTLLVLDRCAERLGYQPDFAPLPHITDARR